MNNRTRKKLKKTDKKFWNLTEERKLLLEQMATETNPIKKKAYNTKIVNITKEIISSSKTYESIRKFNDLG